jgi:uncharacterized protein Veg
VLVAETGYKMPHSLQKIKDDLDARIGDTITVVSNTGRKKVTERQGVLRETYPSLFIVELDDATNFDRVSYSYTDVLTHNIDISFD